MPASADAERFMALLLYAQSSEHRCIFADYFREMGRRMIKEHVREVEESG